MEKHKTQNAEQSIKQKVEQSLNKRFKKELFNKFCRAINEYKMISPGDKIAVCISGGKDSMLMAKLFQELMRRWNFRQARTASTQQPVEIVFLVMNPGYNQKNMQLIKQNAKNLGVPITVFKTDIFKSVQHVEKSPCYLCARMRRGYLYSKAQALGCNKIALGHHYDDVIETILMGVLFSGQFQTMMPKLKSTNFKGMELIRPMYLIREADILHWRDYNNLKFLKCACRFTEQTEEAEDNFNTQNKSTKSMRLFCKQLINQLAQKYPQIENNIFKSVENVNLSTIISYKNKNITHNFLEDF